MTRVHFFCCQPKCGAPAEWRISYETGFVTACDRCYTMAVTFMPTIVDHARQLLDDEAPGLDLVLVKDKLGRIVGGEAYVRAG